MSSSPVIEVRDLEVGYGETVVLRDVSFDVHRGDLFLIIGGSGCGKTTLLRAMTGLMAPRAGTVRIAGIGAPDLSPDRPPAYGVMFQSGALFGSMTLLENVALPLRAWTDLPEDAIEVVAMARLRLVGLQGFENHLPDEISGGMNKRAGIARSLALDPELLFLDEPSAGLDPVTAVAFDELMLTLADELAVTIVLVTHELESILKVGRHCILLDKSTRGILARGDPRELKEHAGDERVRAFFHRLPLRERMGTRGSP